MVNACRTRVFEHEREDHVLNLTIDLIRGYLIRPVNEVSQVDGSRNKEETSGSSVLEVDYGTEDLDADQP